MIGLTHYLFLSGALFAIGALGVIGRRNALVVLMSIELMLNAANLSFLAFARLHADMVGQSAALLVMALAAAEAAVGLALVVLLFRRSGKSRLDDFTLLKG